MAHLNTLSFFIGKLEHFVFFFKKGGKNFDAIYKLQHSVIGYVLEYDY